MLKLLRSVLELIFLAVAINMGYPHAQTIWNYRHNGLWASFASEWAIARQPMLASVIIILLVIIVEVVFVILELSDNKKSERKSDRRWDALFRRLGIDPSEYEERKTKKVFVQKWHLHK